MNVRALETFETSYALSKEERKAQKRRNNIVTMKRGDERDLPDDLAARQIALGNVEEV